MLALWEAFLTKMDSDPSLSWFSILLMIATLELMLDAIRHNPRRRDDRPSPPQR